jgi:hypothetical protein
VKSPTTMKDLEVSLKQDRPGELAKAAQAIANATVNIEGYCEVGGVFHVVTSDAASARKALENVGFSVRESDIVVFEAEDKPGSLAKVLKRIADEEINLTVTYTLTNTRIAIGSNQTARVKEIVQEFSRITA